MNRLLLVEYNPELAKVLSETLAEAGYEVTLHSSYAQADQALAEMRPDVIFLHLRSGAMGDPILSGLEIIRHAKHSNPRVPVVVTTGAESQCILQKAREVGATNVLRLPFAFDHALAAVANALCSQTDSSEGNDVRVT